jgi:hypothetical protein
MARDIQTLGYFELYYPLMQRAVDEPQTGPNKRSGVRHVVSEAGIDSEAGYRAVKRWYDARKQETTGKLARRRLPDKYAAKLIAYLSKEYSVEFTELNTAAEQYVAENSDKDDEYTFADLCMYWGEREWAQWHKLMAKKAGG